MIRYIIRRLLWAVVLFIAVTMVTYIIFFVIPTDQRSTSSHPCSGWVCQSWLTAFINGSIAPNVSR